jgi:hypothetical protein
MVSASPLYSDNVQEKGKVQILLKKVFEFLYWSMDFFTDIGKKIHRPHSRQSKKNRH